MASFLLVFRAAVIANLVILGWLLSADGGEILRQL